MQDPRFSPSHHGGSETRPASPGQVLDLFFPLEGNKVPVDHGYALYAAVSQQLETGADEKWLHDAEDIGVHLIRGRYAGNGMLQLGPGSRLGIRVPLERLPAFLPLGGATLVVQGCALTLCAPYTEPLIPALHLYAHFVTTRHGDDETRFDAEVRRQLDTLEVQGRVERGPRRTITIRERKIVGYALWIGELTAAESLRLQERGIGGRRKMGCGMFLPHQR